MVTVVGHLWMVPGSDSCGVLERRRLGLESSVRFRTGARGTGVPGPWQAGMAVNWKSRSVGQLLLGPGSDLSSLERRRLGCESSGSSETWSPGMVLARAAAGRAMESPGRAVGSVSREDAGSGTRRSPTEDWSGNDVG